MANKITKWGKGVMKSPKKIFAVLMIIALLGVGIWAVIFTQRQGLWSIAPNTTPSASTFKLISYVDGEDVSDFVEITLWVPKGDDYIEEWEDVFTMSNFEEEVSGKDAEDISEDLSSYDYVWVEISPDNTTFYAMDFKLISGGVNALYTYYAYHMPSDLNAQILDVADSSIMLGTKAYNGLATQCDGNFTVILDVPQRYNQELHTGNDWDIDTDDYSDYTEAEKDEMMNQRNWRCIAPVYVPTSDLLKEYDEDLEKITTAYCLEFDANVTVSITNNDAAQFNMTIGKINGVQPPVEVVVVADAILLVFTEPITFVDGPYMFDIEINLARGIEITTVKTGTVVLQYGATNVGAFSALSTIVLEAAR